MVLEAKSDRKTMFYRMLKTNDNQTQKKVFYNYAYKKIEQNRINNKEIDREEL